MSHRRRRSPDWSPAQLSTQTGSALVIAHAWHQPPSLYCPELTIPPEVVQDVIDAAQIELDAAVASTEAAGAKRVSGRLLSGVPWCKIVETLEQERFDLCVIGTEGRTGLRRFLVGSVAEAIVRHAPCSVLAVHPSDAAKPFSHIVVPSDFSAGAACANDTAASLVPADGTITLFHVIEVPIAYPGQHPVRAMEIERCQRASADLERTAQELRSRTKARVRTESKIGHPVHETLALLDRDPSIDLVVVGSHGRTGIKRVLLGSVAEKLVRHAARPVLVARKNG